MTQSHKLENINKKPMQCFFMPSTTSESLKAKADSPHNCFSNGVHLTHSISCSPALEEEDLLQDSAATFPKWLQM